MHSLVGRAALVTLLLFALAASAKEAPKRATGWPQFRGPDANSISPETGINKDWANKPPKVLWKVPMSDGGFAGPSVASGMVFIIDHKGSTDIIRAINIQTGRNVWTFEYPDSPRGNYGFARATPVVAGGGLYTMSRLGVLHCLFVKSGRKAWSRNVVKDFRGRLPKWQMAVSPFIDGNKLIVVPGGPNACVAALDRKTGKTIWKGGGSDVAGYATPVKATIGGKKQYVVFTARHVIGVDATSGRLLWKHPWKTNYDVNAATPIVHNDHVFITSGYRHGCALLKVSGRRATPVWQNKTIQSHFNSPLLFDGHIYGSTDPNRLACIELKTGDTKWSHRGVGKGGIIGVDGALITLDGSSGTVTLVEMTPKGYKALGSIRPLGGQSWTAPIVAEGKLIIRNKQAIACIDLK